MPSSRNVQKMEEKSSSKHRHRHHKKSGKDVDDQPTTATVTVESKKKPKQHPDTVASSKIEVSVKDKSSVTKDKKIEKKRHSDKKTKTEETPRVKPKSKSSGANLGSRSRSKSELAVIRQQNKQQSLIRFTPVARLIRDNANILTIKRRIQEGHKDISKIKDETLRAEELKEHRPKIQRDAVHYAQETAERALSELFRKADKIKTFVTYDQRKITGLMDGLAGLECDSQVKCHFTDFLQAKEKEFFDFLDYRIRLKELANVSKSIGIASDKLDKKKQTSTK